MKERWDEYLLKLCSSEISYQQLEDDSGHTKEKEEQIWRMLVSDQAEEEWMDARVR